MSNILVVEYDTAVHSLLKEALELNGFQVFDAYSGTEGVMVFEQHSIDVVLLDLMLPGMSGEDTIKKYVIFLMFQLLLYLQKLIKNLN